MVVLADEAKDKNRDGETYKENMARKRQRLFNEMWSRKKMNFSVRDIIKASFSNVIGVSKEISFLQKG